MPLSAQPKRWPIIGILIPFFLVLVIAGLVVGGTMYIRQKELTYVKNLDTLAVEKSTLEGTIAEVTKALEDLKKDDQYVKNKNLEAEVTSIEDTYQKTVAAYEDILKVKELTTKTQDLDKLFSETLFLLSRRNFASASANLDKISAGTKKLREAIAASVVIPASVPVNNNPPAGGYARQTIKSDIGNYMADIISADLSSTRVVVDSASDGDCKNDCPVLPLANYIARNGGYAGINGSYFCPETYPSCQDKKNSFDTLLMNKNKKYLNSDNNVYSVVPAVIFLGNSVRFVARSLEWGRDTGNDGVLANQPLLLMGGNIQFGGDDDPKKGSRGPRCFVGNKGNTVYIGTVHNATVAEAAHVLKALGLENAINLDSGGSSALWYNGYKVGPGRSIPNAIVFIRR